MTLFSLVVEKARRMARMFRREKPKVILPFRGAKLTPKQEANARRVIDLEVAMESGIEGADDD